MQIYLRYCPICAKENIRHEWDSAIYVPGIYQFIDEGSENARCNEHKDQLLVKLLVTNSEFDILCRFSNDPDFILAMDELKHKDIIEYNMKLFQMKTQLEHLLSETLKA